jgi:glycosyltransferase involved in cell wall biosynthesis
MACEVVPIATNSGGTPELIDHGIDGYLAEVGDIETMAKYGIEILGDDAKLNEMAKMARFKAQTTYCASKIIPMYEDFYREVLERAS